MASVISTQTIVGTVGNVYDLRTIGDDKKAIDFSVAVTPRRLVDKEWVDGKTIWNNVTAWGRLAENISKSLTPGDRVIVIGRQTLKDSYTNKNGDEVPARNVTTAEFVGLEISYSPAESERSTKGGSSNKSKNTESKKESKKQEVDVFADDDDDDDDLDLDSEMPF